MPVPGVSIKLGFLDIARAFIMVNVLRFVGLIIGLCPLGWSLSGGRISLRNMFHNF